MLNIDNRNHFKLGLCIFRFEVLADFQYLVPDMPEFLKEVKDADALDQDIPLHLPPPVFARFDKPQNYNYQSVPHSNKQENNADEERCRQSLHEIIIFCSYCETQRVLSIICL